MLTHLRIALNDTEFRVLSRLAQLEYRDTRQEAAILIRESLERRGLLQSQNTVHQLTNEDGIHDA